MSKFIDNIVADPTGQHCYVPEAMKMTMEETEDSLYQHIMLKEYNVGVRWNIKFRCEEGHVEEGLRNVIEKLKRDVYGELYDKVSDIEQAYYEHDRDAMLKHIRALKKEVFD